jgi:hypothetical protein
MHSWRGRVALVLALLGLLGAAQSARAAGGLLVGVDEDAVKWGQADNAAPLMRLLGLGAVRVTVPWHPGLARVAPYDQQVLERAIVGMWGLRVVASVYGASFEAPRTEDARRDYCAYVRDLLERNPTLNDVEIWTDANDGAYWSPQFNADGSSAAPADYEALLATCWSTLHAARRSVNVIAASASTSSGAREAHDALTWFRKLGAAYRASGAQAPLLDTFGHVPHGVDSAERPWTKHPNGPTVGEGDYDKLMAALAAAFAGTPQPLPGQGNVTIWYLGQGYQTKPDAGKSKLYSGVEDDRGALLAWSRLAARDRRSGRAPDQATQLADGVRIAYCQPGVGAFFNFHLADESSLRGWQSGVLWGDWTPKPSFAEFKRAVTDVSARAVECGAFARNGAPPRPASILPEGDLRITRLRVTSVGPGSATIGWRTSIPAATQVGYGLAASGPTLSAVARDSGSTHVATITGLHFATAYRIWVSAVSEGGQRARAAVDVTTAPPAHSPAAVIGGPARSLLLDGQPFFPFIVWSQCPDGYAADLAAGINLFADNPCGGLQAQLDALGGRALSAAVAGRAGGSGPGLVGFFYTDEPDGLGLTPAQLPPRPAGSAGQIAFLTLTNHFYSAAAKLGWPVDYPGFIAKTDVVGFDLYPLQEWCQPSRLGDVYAAQRELVRLAAPRPTFQWIETTSWKCPDGLTAVTPATVRAESWLAIAGGARGLGFFPATFSPAVGNAIAGVSRDVAKLGPALLAPASAATGEGVYVGARTYAGTTYVIAVNGSFAPVRGRIGVPDLGTRVLHVYDEARDVLSTRGTFTDDFAPLAVHVYIARPD